MLLSQKKLPAITHVDGTARIQTVSKECGGYYDMLTALRAETGCSVVLNTSFNGPGEPIVETPQNALAFLKSSNIDAVYLDGYRITKKQAPANKA